MRTLILFKPYFVEFHWTYYRCCLLFVSRYNLFSKFNQKNLIKNKIKFMCFTLTFASIKRNIWKTHKKFCLVNIIPQMHLIVTCGVLLLHFLSQYPNILYDMLHSTSITSVALISQDYPHKHKHGNLNKVHLLLPHMVAFPFTMMVVKLKLCTFLLWNIYYIHLLIYILKSNFAHQINIGSF